MNKNLPASKSITAGLVGIQGYSGQVLLRLLQQHPYITVEKLFSRSSHPALSTQPISSLPAAAVGLDIVLLATPPEVSMALVPGLLQQKVKVIDLSGAFRLPADTYHAAYGHPHDCPALIAEAIYGLQPWCRAANPAELIANPGCYPTCALLSLLPLLQAGLLNSEMLIIDAKSGVSGAGKKLSEQLLYCEINENFYPYKIGCHQHAPEIKRYAQTFAGGLDGLLFSTSLLPLNRGLSLSLYAPCNNGVTIEDIQSAFTAAYGDYPWVRHAPLTADGAADHLTRLAEVAYTPYTHIVYTLQQGWLTLYACLDNLLKGAASQAIENINWLYHWPPHTGLQHVH